MADKKTTTKPKAVKKESIKKDIKYSDMLKLELKQLKSIIDETKRDIDVLRYNSKLGDVQNIHAYNSKRKYMAKLLTALNAKDNLKEEN